MFKNINSAFMILVSALVMARPALAEGEAHHSGGLPQFDPTSWPSQIFWLAVFFVVLYVVFGKSIIPALGNTIETRSAYIADTLHKAENLSAEAEKIHAEVSTALKAASHKAGAHISEAETTAKTNMSEALAEFRAHYEDRIAATESRIAAATTEAMVDMEKIAASLAAQAAEKIAGIPAGESGAENVVKSLSQKQKQAA